MVVVAVLSIGISILLNTNIYVVLIISVFLTTTVHVILLVSIFLGTSAHVILPFSIFLNAYLHVHPFVITSISEDILASRRTNVAV